MKERPNISIQKKSNTKLEYLAYLATENIQPNVLQSTQVTSKGKTKYKPTINIKKRNLDNINKHRIDMMQMAIAEKGIKPDLLIEYSTYYVLTITTYNIIQGVETPTAKDFDIYCDGLKLDITTYDVKVGENVVITIQKSEAVDDNFDTNNFEIVSKFIIKQ
jgi:hypothetical protein